MSVWVAILVVGAGTIALKALGPVLLGGRALPARLEALVSLLAPTLLAALVVTQTLGGPHGVVADGGGGGLGAGWPACAGRAPGRVVVAGAGAPTALLRAFS